MVHLSPDEQIALTKSATWKKDRAKRPAILIYDAKSSGVHRFEEFPVVLRVAQLVQQEVDGVHRSHRIENTPQHIHFFEDGRIGKQLFLARTGTSDVNRRESPFVRHLAIKDQFGVTRALELFENHFVHSAAGVDQRSGDDGE